MAHVDIAHAKPKDAAQTTAIINHGTTEVANNTPAAPTPATTAETQDHASHALLASILSWIVRYTGAVDFGVGIMCLGIASALLGFASGAWFFFVGVAVSSFITRPYTAGRADVLSRLTRPATIPSRTRLRH